MAPTKADSTELTPLPAPTETTVVDARIEHTEKFIYTTDESTPPPEAAAFIETTDPAIPTPPPTTSGSTRWQPRTATPEPRRAAPPVTVAPTRSANVAPSVPPAHDIDLIVAKLRAVATRARAWLVPHARNLWQTSLTFSLAAWARLGTKIAAVRAAARGNATFDLEARSSDVADPRHAKKWDQFRQGKRSSGYLIKDDK